MKQKTKWKWMSFLLALAMSVSVVACASAEEGTVSAIIKDPISATLTAEHAAFMSQLKEAAKAQYGENKEITDGNYDASLATATSSNYESMTMLLSSS